MRKVRCRTRIEEAEGWLAYYDIFGTSSHTFLGAVAHSSLYPNCLCLCARALTVAHAFGNLRDILRDGVRVYCTGM